MPIQTITIGAGESAWIPSTATILSVDSTNGLTLSSPNNCISTTVPPRKCWKFSWEEIIGEEYDDAQFKSIEINGVVYPFNTSLTSLTYNTGSDLISEIPRVFPPASIVGTPIFGANITITISLPESLGRPMLLWENDSDVNTQYAAILGEEVVCEIELV